jgi:hypothetical protein
MDKKELSQVFLQRKKLMAFLYLFICIALNVFTFLLFFNVYFSAWMLLFHPATLMLSGFYVFLMILKFQFIRIVDRILISDNIEVRVTELYQSLASDLNKTVEQSSLTKKLYLGERTYNKANANIALAKRMDYKIIKGIYNIYK